MFSELNLPVDNNSLFKALRGLKNNKSWGPDLYINEICIHGIHGLALFTFVVQQNIRN